MESTTSGFNGDDSAPLPPVSTKKYVIWKENPPAGAKLRKPWTIGFRKHGVAVFRGPSFADCQTEISTLLRWSGGGE